MSSVRNLKKDIDYLIFEVVSDCFTYSGLHPDEKRDELSLIIADAIDLRNDLIARVNNPDGRDNPKIIRAFYKSVEKELFAGVDDLFSRLSSLSGEKK